MTWSDIKSYLSTMNPESFSKFIDNNDTGTTTPSSLAMFARMTNYKIAGYAHKFSWAVREYTLTLTGASSYDLSSLIPDLSTVYRPYGTNFGGNEPSYRVAHEYNIEQGGQIFTVVGKTIKLKNPPTSGTLTIPYFSNYLVATSGGTRQKDFLAESDVSIIPDSQINLLLEGIQQYIDRRERRSINSEQTILFNGRVVSVPVFTAMMQQAAIDDNALAINVRDYRTP